MKRRRSILDEVFTTEGSLKSLFLRAREETDAGGEVSPETQEQLNCALRHREHVVTELADWYQHTAATLEGLRAQYKPILDRINADFAELEKRQEFIKWCITKALPPAVESQIANERAYVYYKRSTRTIVDDLESIPLEFIEIEKSANKKEIERCIDSGGTVPGARLEVALHPQIKPGGIKAMRAAENRLKRLQKGEAADGDL